MTKNNVILLLIFFICGSITIYLSQFETSVGDSCTGVSCTVRKNLESSGYFDRFRDRENQNTDEETSKNK